MTESPTQPVAKAGLIALMAVGSVVLWLGIPVGWLWIGSQCPGRAQAAGFGPYMLGIGGIAVSVVIVTKLLASLNRAYGRVSGAEAIVRVRAPWHRSMRGEDDSRQPRRCSTWSWSSASRSR